MTRINVYLCMNRKKRNKTYTLVIYNDLSFHVEEKLSREDIRRYFKEYEGIVGSFWFDHKSTIENMQSHFKKERKKQKKYRHWHCLSKKERDSMILPFLVWVPLEEAIPLSRIETL